MYMQLCSSLVFHVCVCVCTQTGAFDHSTFDVEFKCTYFVSALVEFRIECKGARGEIVLCPCTCMSSLSNAFLLHC